ncbi:MAG: ORF6N domain-containing protein, partial [Gemmatimonadetes bacterium]|nr:ORF6N domain-containing protein [Gemmatimonadota bacterium]
MFQLNGEEWAALRSQFVTSKGGRGGRRYPPYAFTEHGAVMAATVLNSERA